MWSGYDLYYGQPVRGRNELIKKIGFPGRTLSHEDRRHVLCCFKGKLPFLDDPLCTLDSMIPIQKVVVRGRVALGLALLLLVGPVLEASFLNFLSLVRKGVELLSEHYKKYLFR